MKLFTVIAFLSLLGSSTLASGAVQRGEDDNEDERGRSRQCRVVGSGCVSARVCCSGTCTSNVCAPDCLGDGTACTSNAGCCTGNCVSGTCNAADLQAQITTNTNAITGLNTQVGTNTNAISTMNGQVTGNTNALNGVADVAAVKTTADNAAADIVLANSDITTNANAITGLNTQVGTNTNAISTMNGQVTGNTNAIAANTAALCTKAGASCSPDGINAECCSGLCESSFCVTCLGDGEGCSTNSQCCSASCDVGVTDNCIPECQAPGGDCEASTSGECCDVAGVASDCLPTGFCPT